jgi:hypothetical protein
MTDEALAAESLGMEDVPLSLRVDALERASLGSMRANGKHASVERVIAWVGGTACITLLSIMAFLGNQIWSHVADGTKHENGEQKTLRIDKRVHLSNKGIELRLNEIADKVTNIAADVRVLKETKKQ